MRLNSFPVRFRKDTHYGKQKTRFYFFYRFEKQNLLVYYGILIILIKTTLNPGFLQLRNKPLLLSLKEDMIQVVLVLYRYVRILNDILKV